LDLPAKELMILRMSGLDLDVLRTPRQLTLMTKPLLLLAFSSTALFADVTIEPSPAGAVIKIDGEFFTEYVSLSENRPILYPIIGPAHQKMTRDYPMAKVAGERQDHVHHRSLWFAHQEVNGYDFWSEKASFPEGKKDSDTRRAKVGLQKHREFTQMKGDKFEANLTAITDWIAPDGKKQLEDERRITFRIGEANSRVIDFDIDLKATEGPVTWGDNKDGTFGLRVPTSMDVEREDKTAGEGHILTSAGLVDSEAWGKPATWVDYMGPINGKPHGIAILNHPSSFRHPTHWHVRTYGLFCANCFALQSFDKTNSSGAYVQKAGETIKFRFRLIFHIGDTRGQGIPLAYDAYAREARP
jgi:hypothetical protein